MTLDFTSDCEFYAPPTAALVARFTIPGEPASKSRARFTKRGSKTFAYTPEKTKQAEARMAAAFLSVADRQHAKQEDATYAVSALFRNGTRQRRDVDNMLKLICDGLNGIAWHDDSQVTVMFGRKEFVKKEDARTDVIIFRLSAVIDRPTLDCKRCGTTFPIYDSLRGKRQFCNRECGYKWRTENRKRICLNCEVEFLAPSPNAETKYCSVACKAADANVTLDCLRCGAAFQKPKAAARKGFALCSKECQRVFHNERRKGAAKGTCQDCGGPTSKKTYNRCAGCCRVAGGKWADRDNSTTPPLSTELDKENH